MTTVVLYEVVCVRSTKVGAFGLAGWRVDERVYRILVLLDSAPPFDDSVPRGREKVVFGGVS